MARAESVAFVCPRFAEGGTTGGAETLFRALAERLAGAGRRVTFLTTCARDHFTWANVVPPGRQRFGAFDVHYFPVDPDRDVELFLQCQTAINRRHASPEEEMDWVRNSVNSRALLEHLRNHGTDYDRIIVGPYLFGLTYFAGQVHPAKTFMIPCLHDEPFAYLGIMKTLFRSVAGCLFNSEPERDLARRLYEIEPDRSAIVGMGFDSFEANPAAFAARHGLTGRYVIYSGRREGGKGTPLLTSYMHAFRQRTGRDITLVFTGSGPIEAPAELRPHILDVGFVSETEKREAMAGAIAFIHPSLYESLGIVILESFLTGTPALVHARSPVLRWQCERSGAGLWFQNYPEFEEELLLLMDHEDLRRAMGTNGRNYVSRQYAWNAVENRMFEAIDR